MSCDLVKPGATENGWNPMDVMQSARAAFKLPSRLMFQWKDLPASGRPYKTPEDEYLRSVALLSEGDLRFRWEGLPEYELIPAVFNNPHLLLDRQRRQDITREERVGDIPDFTDPAYKKHNNAYFLMRIRAEIDRIAGIIDTGQEPHHVMRKVRDPQTGRVDGEEIVQQYVPLTAKAMRDYQYTLDEKMKLYKILEAEGEAINRQDAEREKIEGRLNINMVINDPATAQQMCLMTERLAGQQLELGDNQNGRTHTAADSDGDPDGLRVLGDGRQIEAAAAPGVAE